jgi:hypothetical protein
MISSTLVEDTGVIQFSLKHSLSDLSSDRYTLQLRQSLI